MVYPLVPLFLSSTLGAPASVIGVVEGSAEATASICKWIFGSMSDRLGKRRPFCIAGYGLAALTKPLLALASAWPLVLYARILDRFGKGLRGSPRDALIADSTPHDLRGRAFGLHRSGDSIGAVCGPLLTLLLISRLQASYQFVFILAFVPGLLSTLLLLLVHERRIPGKTRQILSLAAVRNSPGLRHFLLITLIFSIGNSSDMFLILRAKEAGHSGATVVAFFALCNLLNVLSSFPAGILSDRWGRRTILTIGFFLFSGIYLAFGVVRDAASLWALFAAYGVYLGLTDGVSKALAVDLVSTRDRGSALGMQAAISGVCALPASIAAGLLWKRIGPEAAFIYGAITAAIAGLLMLLLSFRPQAEAQ